MEEVDAVGDVAADVVVAAAGAAVVDVDVDVVAAAEAPELGDFAAGLLMNQQKLGMEGD